MIDLPDRVVVPLGRATSVVWDPAAAERVVSIAVPGGAIGLTEDEHAIWAHAARGVSKGDLLERAPVDGPRTAYDAVHGYGLLVEIATGGATALREAASLRLLAHARSGVHPRQGLVVGEPAAEFVRLSPVVQEIYGWCAGTHSLAMAVVLVATAASEAGVNDPAVIRPERLVRRAFAELFPLVGAGLASFGPAEGLVA
ncbi:hypothetical protein [Cumulibacter manganitolerans]|uniref:hypothetical protein n=1 Tax=Cumulibacter manganitolerans TaxID=1884992 RepID=UPI001295D0E4|nr:hypothetical protein [Cumulibacter manganitolerans]